MRSSVKLLFGSAAVALLSSVGFIAFGAMLNGVVSYIIFFGVLAAFLAVSVVYANQLSQAFWKAVSSKNVLLVQRADGFLEMTEADYMHGWFRSKFGFHIVSDKLKEVTTGKNIALALDEYGGTAGPEDLAAVEEFAKENNIKSAQDLDLALSNWHRCEKCGWEGIPTLVTAERESDVAGIKSKQIEIVGKKCPKCEAGDEHLVQATPTVLVPLYKTVSLENVKYLMKKKLHPGKASVLVDRLVKVKTGFNDKMLDFLGHLLGYGVFAVLVFIGIGLFLKFSGLMG